VYKNDARLIQMLEKIVRENSGGNFSLRSSGDTQSISSK